MKIKRRWAALPAFAAVIFAVWWGTAPRIDPRIVGEWEGGDLDGLGQARYTFARDGDYIALDDRGNSAFLQNANGYYFNQWSVEGDEIVFLHRERFWPIGASLQDQVLQAVSNVVRQKWRRKESFDFGREIRCRVVNLTDDEMILKLTRYHGGQKAIRREVTLRRVPDGTHPNANVQP